MSFVYNKGDGKKLKYILSPVQRLGGGDHLITSLLKLGWVEITGTLDPIQYFLFEIHLNSAFIQRDKCGKETLAGQHEPARERELWTLFLDLSCALL